MTTPFRWEEGGDSGGEGFTYGGRGWYYGTKGLSRKEPIWGGEGSQATCSGLSETDGVHIQNELQIQHKELMSYNNRIAIFPVPSVPYMSIYMLTQ